MPLDLIAFVGPSLSAKEASRLVGPRGAVWGPARRGDVFRALAERPRALALVDGFFESAPSVWHRELVEALEQGVTVWGASSMGALRAVELLPFGMRGVGQVFAWVRDGVVEDDAEVALLHAGPEHGYHAFTVPWVTVHHAALSAQRRRVLTKAQAHALSKTARRLFYQQRTWETLLARVGFDARTRAKWNEWFARHFVDVKALDARLCLARARKTRPRPRPPKALHSSDLADRLAPLLAREGNAPPSAPSTPEALRRALLLKAARAQGLEAPPERVEAVRRRLGEELPGGLSPARAAADLALEELLLEHPARLFGSSGLSTMTFQVLPRRRR